MKKRFVSILCLCMIVMLFSANIVSAAVISDHPLTDEELYSAIQTPALTTYTPCTGGNGICQLYPKGWASVYDENGKLIENLTCAWQCKNCHTVMITSGDPKAGTIIGDYVVVACGYDLGNSFWQYVYINRADIRRCESNHMAGYAFQNN